MKKVISWTQAQLWPLRRTLRAYHTDQYFAIVGLAVDVVIEGNHQQDEQNHLGHHQYHQAAHTRSPRAHRLRLGLARLAERHHQVLCAGLKVFHLLMRSIVFESTLPMSLVEVTLDVVGWCWCWCWFASPKLYLSTWWCYLNNIYHPYHRIIRVCVCVCVFVCLYSGRMNIEHFPFRCCQALVLICLIELILFGHILSHLDC